MICKECGFELNDSDLVCSNCGAPQLDMPEEEKKAESVLEVVPEPVDTEEKPLSKREIRKAKLEEAMDPRNKMGMLSTKSIFWSWIVMSLPVAGILFALIWSCGLCRKAQKKYIARAYLLLTIACAALIGIGYVVYTLILGFTLADLPAVLTAIGKWFASIALKLFGKA